MNNSIHIQLDLMLGAILLIAGMLVTLGNQQKSSNESDWPWIAYTALILVCASLHVRHIVHAHFL